MLTMVLMLVMTMPMRMVLVTMAVTMACMVLGVPRGLEVAHRSGGHFNLSVYDFVLLCPYSIH